MDSDDPVLQVIARRMDNFTRDARDAQRAIELGRTRMAIDMLHSIENKLHDLSDTLGKLGDM
jgi:hypothetical protein